MERSWEQVTRGFHGPWVSATSLGGKISLLSYEKESQIILAIKDHKRTKEEKWWGKGKTEGRRRIRRNEIKGFLKFSAYENGLYYISQARD